MSHAMIRRFLDRLVRWLAPGFAAALLCNCAGSFEEARVAGAQKLGSAPPDVEHCRGLDSAHRNWGAAAVGLGVLAGGSGLGVYFGPDDNEAQLAIAGGGLLVAGGAAFSKFQADSAAESYVRDCSAR